MIYVALMRGINVGGKNKVEMRRLKAVLEQLGFSNVRTYINSGNVIFSDTSYENIDKMTKAIEKKIETEFGFYVKTLVKDFDAISAIAAELPDNWVNDKTMKCDVMFLWENYANVKVLDQLIIKPGLDEVKYVAGAVIWRVDRPNVTRSGLMKLVGTDLYKHMTIRNCNTVRKLYQLMRESKIVQ